jgi:hypothetical protein
MIPRPLSSAAACMLASKGRKTLVKMLRPDPAEVPAPW